MPLFALEQEVCNRILYFLLRQLQRVPEMGPKVILNDGSFVVIGLGGTRDLRGQLWNSRINSMLRQPEISASDVLWIVAPRRAQFRKSRRCNIRCRFVSADGMLEVVVVNGSARIASNLPVISTQTECPRREEENVRADWFHQNLVANQFFALEIGSCIGPRCASIAWQCESCIRPSRQRCRVNHVGP